MKRLNLLATTAVLIAGICFTSCNTPAKRDANENVQENSRDLNATDREYQKVATPEEWNVFKKEQEVKIKENELRIAELREKIAKPGTNERVDENRQEKIAKLEQQNNILKAKLTSYESNQTDWDTFKREFNNDVDEYGRQYDDLSKDNTN